MDKSRQLFGRFKRHVFSLFFLRNNLGELVGMPKPNQELRELVLALHDIKAFKFGTIIV